MKKVNSECTHEHAYPVFLLLKTSSLPCEWFYIMWYVFLEKVIYKYTQRVETSSWLKELVYLSVNMYV